MDDNVCVIAENLSSTASSLLCRYLINENNRHWLLIGIQVQNTDDCANTNRVIIDKVATLFHMDNDYGRLIKEVEEAREKSKAFVSGMLALDRICGSKYIQVHALNLHRGDRICITSQGLAVYGVVESAKNWGTSRQPDWYIEMLSDTNGHYYWKQEYDGGYVIKEDPQ